ncbi:MAG: hypothetical protein U9Q03_05810 [Patescibacteria group bacterium]|nr:hypothetical protein [Patescibacteria group bacterium]
MTVKRMKVVAVLGKYYVPKRTGIGDLIFDSGGRLVPDFNAMENLRRLAQILHVMLWNIPDVEAGFICPHMNTGRFELLTRIDEDRFQEFYRQLIERSVDAAILVPNWRDSSGTLKEIKLFNRLDRPVFEELQSLHAWMKNPWTNHRFNNSRGEIVDGTTYYISYLPNRTAPALTEQDLWTYDHLDKDCIPQSA